MTNFEYACPDTEQEAVEMLREAGTAAAVLAAGTDLVTLLKTDVVQPQRVVDISRIDSLRGIEANIDGVLIGALTTLEELNESTELADYPCIRDVVAGTLTPDLHGAAMAYDCVYGIEVVLLLATLATMLPLMRRAAAYT